MSSSDGITVQAELKFDAPAQGASAAAQANWAAAGGSGDIPCATGSNQDGIIVGTLAFTNRTPSYTPDFYINFSDMRTGGSILFGVGYSDGPQCVTNGSDGWEGSAIQPNWTRAQWGPVPIAIVVTNYYGPSQPDGNPGLLGTTSVVVNSQSAGSYSVQSTSGIVTQLNGPVMTVDLSKAAASAPTGSPSTTASTAVAGYQTYRNTAFGFSIQLPASFTAAGASPVGFGASYTSPDGSERVTSYAQKNAAHKTAAALLQGFIKAEQNAGAQITFSAASGTVYSCSGYDARGQIFYIHGVIGPHNQYELDWLYPKSDKNTLDPAVQHSVATFKPGPL